MGMNQQECWYFESKARLWVLETKMGVSTAKDIHSNRNITIAPLLDGNSPLDHPKHITLWWKRGEICRCDKMPGRIPSDCPGDRCPSHKISRSTEFVEWEVWVLRNHKVRIWENAEASNLTSGLPKRHWNRKRLFAMKQWCPSSRMYCSFGDSSGFQNCGLLIHLLRLSKSHALYSSSSSTTLSDCDTCRNRKPWDWHFLSKHLRYECIGGMQIWNFRDLHSNQRIVDTRYPLVIKPRLEITHLH